MLFYPWGTEALIIGDCDTYEHMYTTIKEEVENNRAVYEIKADEIDEAQEQLQNEP